jgi:sigma-B regulation protein RsbU (phosphoserine phosphatase)
VVARPIPVDVVHIIVHIMAGRRWWPPNRARHSPADSRPASPFRYAAAGHPGPLILRADGTMQSHDSTGLPIGIVEGATCDERVVEVGAGDRVYLYSDGAIEEMNDRRELFGLERLQSVLADGRAAPLRETLASVIEAIGTWTGAKPFRDDISLAAAEIVES